MSGSFIEEHLEISPILLPTHGVFSSELQLTTTDIDEPSFTFITVKAGLCGSGGSRGASGHRHGTIVNGAGSGLDLRRAAIPAFAELLERYAAASHHESQVVWSSYNDLKGRAMDLDTVPRCSDREMASPRCSLGAPSKDEPLRWVKGLSLIDGEPTWIPAVMVYSHAGWRGPSERFWLPISTGCAAHISYEAALISGICEVVERDAIALTWLQRLALPKIEIDSVSEALAPFWNSYQCASPNLTYQFFNATTDVVLPTVYAIQTSAHHPFGRNIVACAAALTYDEAITKVIKDLAAFKRAFQTTRDIPSHPSAFRGLMDGATYMARPENASAFDFLLGSDRSVSLNQLRSNQLNGRGLADVLALFSALGFPVYAVDLTTDECIRLGMRVVRVVIPALQPFSFHAAAQYLAHPRLYQAPVAMGHVAQSEANLNPWPQPFA